MPAARYDLIIDQGSDFALELTIKDNGSPKDLTLWSGRAQLRKTKEATDPNPTHLPSPKAVQMHREITVK